MSDQTTLEKIEKKVTEAKILVNEAKALAAEAGIEFTVEVTGAFDTTDASGSDFESSDEWDSSGCTW